MSSNDQANKAFHLSLRVRSLSESVEFYGRLFGQAPTKYFADYAKFELSEPALVLSLKPSAAQDQLGLDHLGIRVQTRQDLIDASAQIAERGLAFEHLQGVECCYARQSKIFLNDKDGHLFEIYTVDADLAEDELAAAKTLSAASTLAATQEGVFDHLLSLEFPLPLPHKDHSLNEINLRGTFNAQMNVQQELAILRECHRALAPGGKITVHMLVSDRVVQGDIPTLPEPAAHVRRVPTEDQMLTLFEELGFSGLHLRRLSHASVFGFAGAEFREFLLAAYKPIAASSAADKQEIVVYKGPFPLIQDELGNSYQRGRRTLIAADAARRLRSDAFADSFVFLHSKNRSEDSQTNGCHR